MATTNKETTALVKMPEEGLLLLVAALLKDKQLFPEKMEEAKKFLRNLQPHK